MTQRFISAISVSYTLLLITSCGNKNHEQVEESMLQSTAGKPSAAVVGVSKATELSKNVKAFLDVIAYAEGTHGSYNISYGGASFSGFGDHPRKWRGSPWGTPGVGSDAAGRYQFKSTSWDEARSKKGLRDFSPQNQDKAAVYLIERNGKSTLENVKNAHDKSRFIQALTALSHTWASFPPQRYKNQKVKKADELWAVFQKALDAYK